MKNKKVLIIAVALILVGSTLITTLFFINKEGTKSTSSSTTLNQSEAKPPASDSVSLKRQLIKLEGGVAAGQVSLKGTDKLKNIDKVKIWVYSQPIYLGVFTIKDNNGTKEIIGLYDAINNNVDGGIHAVAVSTENGEALGYIEIEIDSNKAIKLYDSSSAAQVATTSNQTTAQSTTEALVVVEEKIAFSIRSENEVNQAKGTAKISQAGQEGTKKVTYKVVSGSDGRELSRTKVSEQTTKQPTEQVTKVGLSDYNLNDNIQRTGVSGGLICLVADFQNYGGGASQCPDEYFGDATKSNQFYSFNLNISGAEKQFLHCFGSDCISTQAINVKPAAIINGKDVNLNGSAYKIDERLGAGPFSAIDETFCNNYGLLCGRW